MRISLLLSRSPRTSFARQRNLHSVNIKSKVLQTVRVANCLCGVVLRQLQALSVGICVVLGSALSDFDSVVETVHQVCGEVCCELVVGDGVAIAAHGLQGFACGVGKRADDCFVSGVLATPVATPTYRESKCQCCCTHERVKRGERTFLVAVSIDIITTENDTLMVPVNKLLIPPHYFSSRCLTKILAVNLGLVAVGVDVLGSLLSNLDGVTKSLFELNSLGVVAGGMNREALDLDGWLGVGSRCGTRDSNGSDFSVLDDWRSSSGSSKCCTEKELGTHIAKEE